MPANLRRKVVVLHNINPIELKRLSDLFGYETLNGYTVPAWLRLLHKTAVNSCEDEDFEITRPKSLVDWIDWGGSYFSSD